MVARAEKIADGRVPLKKARFLKVTGATKELDQATIDRARQLAGLKGYVTSLPTTAMDGAAVIAAYHDLWRVEQSFRMAKSDLRARPVFHHQRDAIEAHLTCVRRPGRGPPPPRRHRRHDQEARPDPATATHRDHCDRRAHPHRGTADQHRRPRHPRPTTPDQRPRALSLCKSGMVASWSLSRTPPPSFSPRRELR